MLRLDDVAPGLRVHYVLLSGSPERQAEAHAAASAFLPACELTLAMHDLPDGRLPGQLGSSQGASSTRQQPTCHPTSSSRRGVDDAHQDHRLLGEVATQAFRDHLVLHYEIPKWDGDLGRANLYVPVPDDLARRKVELLNAHFPSQKHHDWWDDEMFLGLMRLRGMECRARYAEAFSCSKGVLSVQ